MKAKEILAIKGSIVHTINENDSINSCLKKLVEHNIGVLPVVNNSGKLRGMLSERDIIKLLQRDYNNALNFSVKDIMTTNILYADYEDSIDYIESVMTENKVRHIPIMKDGNLTGLISIGDIVKATLNDKQFENKFLLEYIQG